MLYNNLLFLSVEIFWGEVSVYLCNQTGKKREEVKLQLQLLSQFNYHAVVTHGVEKQPFWLG